MLVVGHSVFCKVGSDIFKCHLIELEASDLQPWPSAAFPLAFKETSKAENWGE
jgi:hypothetical protein